MGVLAVLLVQVLDPLRVVLVAGVVVVARLVENRAMRWPLFVAGLALVAFAIPQFLSMRGDLAAAATLIGIVANAILAGIIYGVWKLFRYWF